MVDLFRARKWDLVGRRNIWFAISLIVIATGLVAWSQQGLNLGVDFTGGGLITYQFEEPIAPGRETATLAAGRTAVEAAGVEAQLQLAGSATRKDQLLVRTRVEPEADKDRDVVLREQNDRILAELQEPFPGIESVARDLVTPVVSKELIRNAIYAVAWGCIFILIWIRIRYFDFKWASSALIALVHDVLVLLGAFALTQNEVNSPFVAAALTVVGYSVHDTIVLFDRIRENIRLRKGSTFGETANISLLETMARSVNTVLTVLLVLVAVYLLGGASLRTFTFALIVGILAGGYSSIFTASQVLVVMKNREERGVARRRAEAGVPRRRPRRHVRPVERAAPESAAEPAQEPAEEDAQEPAAAAEKPTAAPAQRSSSASKGKSRSERKKLKAGRKRKRRF